ncbi:MAG: septum formation initiator family protein [Pseudomonadota bacterium]
MSNAFKKSSRGGAVCLAVAVIAGAGYFAHQSFGGSYGMEARAELDVRADALRSELTALKQEEARMERRVAGLTDGQIDQDLLEEQARHVLHFAKPGDVVVR